MTPGTNTHTSTPNPNTAPDPGSSAIAPNQQLTERRHLSESQLFQAISARALHTAGVALDRDQTKAAREPIKPKGRRQRKVFEAGMELADAIKAKKETVNGHAELRISIDRGKTDGRYHKVERTESDNRATKRELDRAFASHEIDQWEYERKAHHLGHPSSPHHTLKMREMTDAEKRRPYESEGEKEARRDLDGLVLRAFALREGHYRRGLGRMRAMKRIKAQISQERQLASGINWEAALEPGNIIDLRVKIDDEVAARTQSLIDQAVARGESIEIDDNTRLMLKRRALRRLLPKYLNPQLQRKDIYNARIVPPDKKAVLVNDLLVTPIAELLDRIYEPDKPATDGQTKTERKAIWKGQPVEVIGVAEKDGRRYVYLANRTVPVPAEEIEEGSEENGNA